MKELPVENNTYINFKPRFKAIEGFLRRVAFNLGNTPSQTEVKIISCIPIDVTELQLKIFELQKQLEESKHRPKKETTINVNPSNISPLRDIICPSCNTKQPNAEIPRCNSSLSKRGPCSTSETQRSTISFIQSNVSTRNSPYYSEEVTNTLNKERVKKLINLFSKKRKASKKKKQKAHVVYYAHTDTKTPFCNPSQFSLSDDMTSKNFDNDASKSVPFARSHILNAVQKQHKTQSVLNNVSILSDFSSPVCRDSTLPTCSFKARRGTDAYSCFHGQFQNIDHLMNNHVKLNLYPTYENYENYMNTYYDSNFYDVVPVREKRVKIRNDVEIQKRKIHKKSTDMKRWPEKERPKYRAQPAIVNYCAVPPRDNFTRREPGKSQNRRDFVMNQMAAKRVPRDTNTLSVDCGPVYTKPIINEKQPLHPTTSNRRDFSCLTTAKNNTECQTPSIPAENPPESQTETTLNQIKSMLQSVLNEVKISSKLSKPLPKKDAFVQNGPSQGNMYGESQLLESFTYSPYNMHPYIASYSRQIPTNGYTYPGAPDHCLHHYPLLIEPHKHICSSCCRNKHVAKSVDTYHAASAGTNTEQNQRSKETEQLIKEIYKSLAMNIEIPSSMDNTVGEYAKLKSMDNTVGEYAKLKSTVKASTNFLANESNKGPKHIANSISEIFKNTNTKNSTCTRNTESSKLTSNVSSTVSEHDTKISGGNKIRSERVRSTQNVSSSTETMDGESEPEQMSHNLDITDQTEDSEGSSSETETDDVVVEVKKSAKAIDTNKAKNGLFNKMFKIFKPRQRGRKKEDIKEVENESDSDSDDYQTVYSHNVEAPQTEKGIHIQHRPHSKVFYVKQSQQRPGTRSTDRNVSANPRTSPYMEQEYRRNWDEKLMFHKMQDKRYSTETSRNADTRVRRPVYSQNYEARSALVERIRQVPLRMPGNTHMPQYKANDRYTPGNGTIDGKIHPKYPANSTYYPGTKGHNNIKPHYISSKSSGQRKTVKSAIGAAWLKRHKLGIKCTGQQWKKLVHA